MSDPVPPQDDQGQDIQADVFNAKDIRLGIISSAAESILAIPDTKNLGIKNIRQAGLKLVESARSINGLFPSDRPNSQLKAMVEGLGLVDLAFSYATVGDREFDENGFVVDLAINMAAKLCRLEAAKTLKYSSTDVPERFYDTFLVENTEVIEAVKNSYNLKKGNTEGWGKLVESHRQSELVNPQKEIEP